MNLVAKPKVSIIVPCFNAGRFLHESVESILATTGVLLEVLVIDDGSTDGAVYGLPEDHRIRLLCKGNGGAAQARNWGIREAKGEFITFLDADDRMAAEAIAWRLDWLESRPREWGVAGRVAGIIDRRGKTWDRSPTFLTMTPYRFPSG